MSTFSVFIDTDNSQNNSSTKLTTVDTFNSKNALQNFKRDVRNFLIDEPSKTVNLSELAGKYIKKEALISIKEQNKDSIRFVISMYYNNSSSTQQPSQSNLDVPSQTNLDVPSQSNLDVLKQTLKQRLKLNSCVRSNRQYAFQSKADSKMTKDEKDKKLDNDIIMEYSKIVRMFKFSSNIPSPKDIFAKPKEYKEAINLIMNDSNGMFGKLPSSHPYVRYFTLLQEKMEKMD
jgi:hypothetical protein